MPQQPHILFLLNPGRTSRPYLLGLRNGAARCGLAHTCLELGPVWDALSRAADKAATLAGLQREIAALVRQRGVTHAMGYAFNGADLGLVRTGENAAAPLLAALGVHHFMLWTDHPEWCMNGAALADGPRRLLGNPLHTHIVKSDAAAEEAMTVLGWENFIGMPMGEDTHEVRPARGITPIHDVCIVMSDPAPMPEALREFLRAPEPDVREMDLAMLPAARAAFLKAAAAHGGEGMESALGALADDWLAAKISARADSYHRLSLGLDHRHSAALSWLAADPRRWYAAIAGLRRMVAWRRNFWPAWLARRFNVGVYGCDASCLGISQPPGAEAWVAYQDLPAVFARGRVAMTINAAHDEEGVTHKGFQIGAAGVACLHHDSRGLADLYEPGAEIGVFSDAARLEAAVRSMMEHPARRQDMAEAMRARTRKSHDWAVRLTELLSGRGTRETRSEFDRTSEPAGVSS